MDKYAVVVISGNQYVVKEKDEILVSKISGDVSPRVLLVAESGKVTVGAPEVKGAVITIKNLGDEKGEKLYVQKYKAKSRYRRKIGFRPQYTKLLIEKIVS